MKTTQFANVAFAARFIRFFFEECVLESFARRYQSATRYHRAVIAHACAAACFLCSSAAAQSYQAIVGPFNSGAFVSQQRSSCLGSSFVVHATSLRNNPSTIAFLSLGENINAYEPNYATGKILLNSPLNNVAGRWNVASISYVDPPGSSHHGVATTTLTKDGILTTTYSFYDANRIQWGSGTETIDLNTGETSSSFKAIQQVADNICPSGFVTFVITGQVSGVLNISLIPSTATALGIATLNPYYCKIAGHTCDALPSSTQATSLEDVTSAPAASAISVDGQSAAVVMVSSADPSDPVRLTLSAPVGFSGSLGLLAHYDPNFLTGSPAGTDQPLELSKPDYCDSQGNCIFLALLWAPTNLQGGLPSSPNSPVPVTITATQSASSYQTGILLQPPPLVLVHGLWSSAAEAWPDFQQWLSTNYPHSLIFPADYQPTNSKAYNDPATQTSVAQTVANALKYTNSTGVVARSVDVVAHSMGGLVTEYLIENTPLLAVGWWPNNPVHQLITIGTPYNGSPLANTLWNHQGDDVPFLDPVSQGLCLTWLSQNGISSSTCSLGELFASIGKPVDAGVQSLIPGSQPPDSGLSSAIVGQKPPCSITSIATCSMTELILNAALKNFALGTVESNVGATSDTIVSAESQSYYSDLQQPITFNGIVHTALWDGHDTGETVTPCFWRQAGFWLMGGNAENPMLSGATCSVDPPNPIIDLTGYTQVPSSNVTFSPGTGSSISINSLVNITATSSTKFITEILLFQVVADPSDKLFFSSTQSPFTIAFTPTRMGSTTFTAFAVFSDMTYATTTLNYTFQIPGNPLALNLINPPIASMPAGSSASVEAQAVFSTGPVDVSQAATYKARSSTTAVFSVGPNGRVTARGSGTDWLDVSYNGLTAAAQIGVGTCTFSVGPQNQLVDYSGGTISIQVTTQAGCGWTADVGETAWLKLTNATGTGTEMITATAAPNTTGSTQTAIITVADQDVAVVQPATACSFLLDQTQVAIPGAGGSGAIGVSTSCPVVASSSDSDWLAVAGLTQSVSYSASPNLSGAKRLAVIRIGTQQVLVTQSSSSQLNDITPPTTTAIANGSTGTNGWYTGPVQVTLSASDPDSPVASTSYGIDGGTLLKYSTPFTISADGVHPISFFSIDPAGNQEPPKSLTIKIDSTPPVVTGTPDRLPNSAGWHNAPVTITWTATDVTSGVASVDPPTTISDEGSAISGVGHATDNAGNLGTATISVNIDRTPPATTASISGPAGLNGWFRGPVNVGLTAVDNLSGVANTALSLDEGLTWTIGTSVVLTKDGIYSISYRSTDIAGNIETAKSITVKIDQTSPTITSTANPSNIWPPNGNMVSVIVAGIMTDNLSGISTNSADFVVTDSYGSVQPAGPVSISANGTYSFTVSLEARRDGQDKNGRVYTIKISVPDNAGNSATSTTTVLVPHDQGQ